MGIGVGGGVGPVRVGVGVSDREAGSFVGYLLLFGLLLGLVFVAIVLAPVAGLIFAARLALRAHTFSALVVAACSVALAVFVWPKAYSIRYAETVPDVTGAHYDVDRATKELGEAGFKKVDVDQEGVDDGDSFCWIESTTPATRESGDQREPVILHRLCSPPAS